LPHPDFNNPATELSQTNKILPEPCDFIRKGLPRCSVIRPSSTRNAGAVAAVQSFIDDNLFDGQPPAFMKMVMGLAIAADAAQRQL
jgi:hypothetical protein